MRGLYQDTDAYLQRLNPLTKVVATAPPLLLLAFTRDPYVPGAFVLVTLLATGVLGRIPPRRLVAVVAPMTLLLVGFLLVYPLAAAGDVVADTHLLLQVGPLEVRQGGVLLGLSTGLRILSLISLTLLFALTTDGMDFIRALVQRWRVPYRIGYAAMAAFRFVPRFGHELQVIAAAHRVRGLSDRGGARARLQRAGRYTVPLLSGGIRHAERVALAMDARGFGAYPDRTYRRELHFHTRDVVFVVVSWTVTAAIVVSIALSGRMAPLSLLT
jgi:energy-coupling factor transport system permease protein